MRKLRSMTTPFGTVELKDIVFPDQANHYGTLFAGNGLQFMAKAAFLAGRSLAQRDVVMAGVTGIEFLSPIPVGHVLTLRAWVSRVGRCSMTVCVTGLAETIGRRRKKSSRACSRWWPWMPPDAPFPLNAPI